MVTANEGATPTGEAAAEAIVREDYRVQLEPEAPSHRRQQK
jgi:Pyruvate/2-oxoacid:ferredoxin oxidoreductase gamma subunit